MNIAEVFSVIYLCEIKKIVTLKSPIGLRHCFRKYGINYF